MMCGRCPLALLCYTQRLMYMNKQKQTYFCPVCKKLIHSCVSLNSVTVYAISCEKCTLSLFKMKNKNKWKKEGEERWLLQ